MFCHSPQAPQKAVAAYRGPPWDTAKLPFGEETSCQKVRHFATKSKFRCVFFFFSIPYLLGKSNAPPDSVTNKTPRSALRFGAFELNQRHAATADWLFGKDCKHADIGLAVAGEQVSHRCNARRPMGFLGSVSDTAYAFIRRLFQPNFTAEYTSK